MVGYIDIKKSDGFYSLLSVLHHRGLSTADTFGLSTKQVVHDRPLEDMLNNPDILIPQSLPELF